MLGDLPFEAANRRGTDLVIGLHHRAQLFGIELLCQRRRADQVTEQHRQLAALGLGPYAVWLLGGLPFLFAFAPLCGLPGRLGFILCRLTLCRTLRGQGTATLATESEV